MYIYIYHICIYIYMIYIIYVYIYHIYIYIYIYHIYIYIFIIYICIKWLTADLAASEKKKCPRHSKGNGARPTLGSSPKISWLTWDQIMGT